MQNEEYMNLKRIYSEFYRYNFDQKYRYIHLISIQFSYFALMSLLMIEPRIKQTRFGLQYPFVEFGTFDQE